MACSRAAVTERLKVAGISPTRIIGATPMAEYHPDRCKRAFEIMEWLRAHGGASSAYRFVVLDDGEVQGEGLQAQYVLRIDPAQALTSHVF